ncbi:GYDIA family GHMP kinase [Flavobacterium sp. MFBS3-15]|uniref:GYDIA family GHMP kinase n=1 Tax=Flavobacterium sp. MFBS3-15 TaxID=2989816 RepID=UPI00223671E7|nr:GYDIA family GHMP kinase [Flavobacterium sp. MFBS3-15]MCW4468700.1 GYDIA family GHMP kinase [Flavobacterium sp. MFBS3-15]
MKKTFYSNGKLLITGEYTVLDGATALALPTKTGQYLDVEETGDNGWITWISLDADGTEWYRDKLPFPGIIGNRQRWTSPEADTLIGILHHAHVANTGLLNNAKAFTVTTRLTFPRHWGLGSSSTLINNIAQWFGIDAFHLLNKSFGGSGYDIACAQNDTAVLYRLDNGNPLVTPIHFNPAFADTIYFVYLNRKQNSREAIAAYREQRQHIAPIVAQIDALTDNIINATDSPSFIAGLEQHEAIMSAVLKTPTVKETRFPDFNGAIKSLGAWGGDFVMAVSENDPAGYFKKKGFEVVVPYREMIL